MSETRKDREWAYYICGQCKDKQYHLRSEQPVVPCPDCGWNHRERIKEQIPDVIKLDLTLY